MEALCSNQAKARAIAGQIKKKCDIRPQIAIVLGSGWGGVVDAMQNMYKIPYADLDGMPHCGVIGHAGYFVLGELDGVGIVLQQGRIHMYEGHLASEAALPVAVMKELGVHRIILTNAAGGVNPEFEVGDLMILSDHINFTGKNPLEGARPTREYPVFVDMSKVYDPKLSDVLNKVCTSMGVAVRNGTYMQVLGPTFETPAEVRAYAKLGADAVGMSTAIEAIYARYLKMDVAAISCITNKAAGLFCGEIQHSDVIAQSKKREKVFAELLKRAAILSGKE